jgi:hypothetical protein
MRVVATVEARLPSNERDPRPSGAAPSGFVEELECGQHLFFRRIRLSPVGRAWKRLSC